MQEKLNFGLVTFLLDRRCGSVRGGVRPAGLGEAGRLGFLPNFGTCSPEITTHPKLVELIRIK